MKKLVFLSLFIPVFASTKAQFTLTNSSTVSIVELRPASDTWPLDLQRIIKQKDTSYALNYRDQQYSNAVIMSTLKFGNKEQLKYFQQALSSLTTLGTGTTANFKGFTIKRADILKDIVRTPAPATPAKATAKADPKKPAATTAAAPKGPAPTKTDEVWYVLTAEDGTVTNFLQSEADKMIAAILPL